jgi:hypothetical protein
VIGVGFPVIWQILQITGNPDCFVILMETNSLGYFRASMTREPKLENAAVARHQNRSQGWRRVSANGRIGFSISPDFRVSPPR